MGKLATFPLSIALLMCFQGSPSTVKAVTTPNASMLALAKKQVKLQADKLNCAVQSIPLNVSSVIDSYLKVPDVCVILKKAPLPSVLQNASIVSSLTVNSFGACVGRCRVTSGCSALAIEISIMKKLASGTCLLGNSQTAIEANPDYLLYTVSGGTENNYECKDC
ncbi:hypothetical protein V1264_012406 [Littorina saxatilis]|uniref:Apple domain-containing protein n=1 Tax=Littorina saxatilis TaxID=31220 RepID=A0AAN9BWC4_9CAEN